MSGVVITSDIDLLMHPHDEEETDLMMHLHDEQEIDLMTRSRAAEWIIEGKQIRLQVVASTHSLTIFPITR